MEKGRTIEKYLVKDGSQFRMELSFVYDLLIKLNHILELIAFAMAAPFYTNCDYKKVTGTVGYIEFTAEISVVRWIHWRLV